MILEKEGYILTDNKSKISIDVVCEMLNMSYWANERPKEAIVKSIENSICFSVLKDNKQVAFSRIVTDYSTFAWLCDVFVLEEHRKKGLGKWLMETIINYPLISKCRILLATRDAHKLYQKYGFIDKECMIRLPE